ATEVKPDDVSAWNNLGYVKLSQGKSEEAVYAFKKGLDIEPDNHGTLLNLGNCYENTGNSEKAIECFRRAVELRPDFYEGWFNLGNQHLSRREYPDAVYAYKRALKYEPESSSARKNIGVAYMNTGDIDNAIDSFLTAVENNPADAGAYINLASVYIKKRLYKKAKEYLLKAVKISPRNQKGWFGLREVALKQGDIDSFFDSTVRLVNRIEPDDIAESLYILRSTDNMDKADKLIRIIYKAGIDSLSISAERMVFTYLREGKNRESDNLWKEVRNSGDPWSMLRAGEYAWYTEDYEAAAEIFSKVFESEYGVDIKYRSIYWRVLIKTNEYDNALNSIYAFIETDPDSSEAYYCLALLYAEQGMDTKSVKFLKRAMSEGLTELNELQKGNWRLREVCNEQRLF
ncbi:MAG: tetratricopeptide repeat protein, partial [Chitinivibrionales bacterium]